MRELPRYGLPGNLGDRVGIRLAGGSGLATFARSDPADCFGKAFARASHQGYRR